MTQRPAVPGPLAAWPPGRLAGWRACPVRATAAA